jgi:hypothetical protein
MTPENLVTGDTKDPPSMTYLPIALYNHEPGRLRTPGGYDFRAPATRIR